MIQKNFYQPGEGKNNMHQTKVNYDFFLKLKWKKYFKGKLDKCKM